MKNILDELKQEAIDMKTQNFEYVSTVNVPSRGDSALTFEYGKDKVGKILETCVLYVDIRDSVALNKKHTSNMMGRLYTCFSKSMLRIAKHHNGSVRNIIGDRVMIVFPKKECFTNAIECAVSINHVSEIINKVFDNIDFKCGIGIDHGEMKVMKVGIFRKGDENIDSKNLVWIGNPANYASRLTDYANKSIQLKLFEVNYKPFDYSILGFNPLGSNKFSLPKAPIVPKKITVREEEFTSKLSCSQSGQVLYDIGNLISFKKINKKETLDPILFTHNVYMGLKNEYPEFISNYWKEVLNHNIPGVTSKIYGGSLKWKIS